MPSIPAPSPSDRHELLDAAERLRVRQVGRRFHSPAAARAYAEAALDGRLNDYDHVRRLWSDVLSRRASSSPSRRPENANR